MICFAFVNPFCNIINLLLNFIISNFTFIDSFPEKLHYYRKIVRIRYKVLIEVLV